MKHKINLEQLELSRFLDLRYLKFLYFSRRGRISMERFYIAQILYVLSSMFMFMFVFNFIPDSAEWIVGLVLLPFCPLILYTQAALYIKRAHDLNRSGHFCWLLLIPPILLWPLVESYLLKGTTGDNRFGPEMTV